MTLELKKRILTSICVFSLLIIILIYSEFILVPFLLVFYALSIYEVFKNSKSLLFTSIANIVLFISFYAFYYLRGETVESLIFLCWGIFSTIFSDIGGYVIGKLFKGKKITKISPNKTYSGSIGSLIFSLLSLPILNFTQNLFLKMIYFNFFQVKFIILTAFISLIAQAGDIYVSYWKRKFKIKDTGTILPGHGGILDRIDGLIFVLIFLYSLKLLKLF